MDSCEMKARTFVLGAGAIGLPAAAMHYALRGLDWGSFVQQLHLLDWRWLIVAVCLDIAGYVAQGLRWSFLLRGASLLQTTRAIYAGLFCNEMVPFRPGEAVRAWIASRDLRVGMLKVAPSIVTERLMDALWLAAALLCALAFAPLPDSLTRICWVVILCVAIGLPLVWLLGRTRFAAWDQALAGLCDARALLASGGFLFAQGLAFWAVARASHLRLSVPAAFVVMLVVRIGTMLPGAPANLGTHQFSTVLGLSLYGIGQPAAASFSLVVFVVLTAPLLGLGFVACLNAGLNWSSVRALAYSPEKRRSRTISTNDTKILTSPNPLTVPRK